MAAVSQKLMLTAIDLRSNENMQITYKMSQAQPMAALMRHFCQTMGYLLPGVEFSEPFLSRAIQPDDTPQELGLQDGDIIQVREIGDTTTSNSIQRVNSVDTTFLRLTTTSDALMRETTTPPW